METKDNHIICFEILSNVVISALIMLKLVSAQQRFLLFTIISQVSAAAEKIIRQLASASTAK